MRAALDTRDSLAKIMYSKLFDWLVERINNSIGEDKNCAASVGVLDIYGTPPVSAAAAAAAAAVWASW